MSRNRFQTGVLILAVLAFCCLSDASGKEDNDQGVAHRVAALESSLAALQAKVATQQAEIIALKTESSSQQAAINALKAENSSQQAEINALKAQVNSLNGSITAHVGNTSSAHNYDARFVRQFEGTLQLLRGWVLANGTVQAGSGFSVSRTATGTYTLTPNNNFGDWPAAVITPMDVDPACFVRWNSISTTGMINFSLRERELLLDSDQEWCFSLIGPH